MANSADKDTPRQTIADSPEAAALRKDIEQLRKDLAALAESVRHRSSDQVQAGFDTARQHAGDLGREIEARPLTSVAAAFGIGLLLGKLFSR